MLLLSAFIAAVCFVTCVIFCELARLTGFFKGAWRMGEGEDPNSSNSSPDTLKTCHQKEQRTESDTHNLDAVCSVTRCICSFFAVLAGGV